jgi:hypothetical protein
LSSLGISGELIQQREKSPPEAKIQGINDNTKAYIPTIRGIASFFLSTDIRYIAGGKILQPPPLFLIEVLFEPT